MPRKILKLTKFWNNEGGRRERVHGTEGDDNGSGGEDVFQVNASKTNATAKNSQHEMLDFSSNDLRATLAVLNLVLGSSPESERYKREELLPAVQQRFGPGPQFSEIPSSIRFRSSVLVRLQGMAGLNLNLPPAVYSGTNSDFAPSPIAAVEEREGGGRRGGGGGDEENHFLAVPEPFDSRRVLEAAPVLKRLPLVSYAKGTALFILARRCRDVSVRFTRAGESGASARADLGGKVMCGSPTPSTKALSTRPPVLIRAVTAPADTASSENVTSSNAAWQAEGVRLTLAAREAFDRALELRFVCLFVCLFVCVCV